MDSYQVPDGRLVDLAREGEREAFDALFARYLPLVRGEARRSGLQASEGDVVQETFLQAYLNIRELRDPGRFASWLRTISHRVCISQARSRTREETLVGQLPAPPEPADDFELRQFLAGLPPEDGEPLYLHYVLGFDTAAGARALGLTPTAFRVRLHRARKRARALARSQRIEERIIMAGQDRSRVARQLFAEAEATAWARSRARYEEAYQADPNNDEVAWNYGRKLERDGEYREAIKVLQPLWERTSDAWTGLTLAWCHDYLGHRDLALGFYAQVGTRQTISETQRRIAAAGIEAPQRPKTRPIPPKGLVELAHTGWSAAASHAAPNHPVRLGIDGDVSRCWSPGDDCQAPGMWYRIDLGEEVEGLAGIWTGDDAGGESFYKNGAPRHCLVSVSRDGESWKPVGEYRWSPNTYMEAWWEPVSARYLLMEQMGHAMPEWWCIHEAHVFQRR